MNKKLLGATLGAVFVFAMMTNPVFAVSPNLKIDTASDYSMTVVGDDPGKGTWGHDVVVYAFFTDADGPVLTNGPTFIAEVAAYHPKFVDDSEQVPAKPKAHAHELYLDVDTLCVEGLDVEADPEVTITGSTVSVPQSNGGNVVAHVIAGYDFTDDGLFGGSGLCPTAVYDLQPAA